MVLKTSEKDVNTQKGINWEMLTNFFGAELVTSTSRIN